MRVKGGNLGFESPTSLAKAANCAIERSSVGIWSLVCLIHSLGGLNSGLLGDLGGPSSATAWGF